MEIIIEDLNELSRVAEELLKFANGQKFFAFKGEMGAGKTTFIKVFCKLLGVQEVVSSPTFSIVNEYLIANHKKVYHFDFYRLKSVQEAYDIGYEDYFYSDNYCLIEWPQIVEEILPEQYIQVSIQEVDDGKRRFEFIK